jgi:predicted TIM-barrel fold metal-dependent hydrolase
VISADSHAGPTLEGQLRPYCPQKYLDAFDEFAAEVRRVQAGTVDVSELRVDQVQLRNRHALGEDVSDDAREAFNLVRECGGQYDPTARLEHMDADGVTVDVIFGGGQNGEVLPFVGFGTDAGPPEVARELRAIGGHIWNAWLADFIAGNPERHVGVMQIPVWDIDETLKEITWGVEHGLRAVNLPAPRADYTSYAEPAYEPLWALCQDMGLPLVTHSGGG